MKWTKEDDYSHYAIVSEDPYITVNIYLLLPFKEFRLFLIVSGALHCNTTYTIPESLENYEEYLEYAKAVAVNLLQNYNADQTTKMAS